MQFTPQQMAGAQRYGSHTRIGNWYEDERLAEARFQVFVDKKERNLLASDHRRRKIDTCLRKVSLSSSDGRLLRYGATVQLQSLEVDGCLACDPFEETSPGSRSYVVTVCPSRMDENQAGGRVRVPARTAFRVMKVTDPRLKDMATQVQLAKDGLKSLPGGEGDPVCCGDEFHLQCDPGLLAREAGEEQLGPPLYLASALKTQVLASKVSNRQAVFLQEGATSGTVWKFQRASCGGDGVFHEILARGTPVMSGTEMVVRHRDTLMALSCEKRNTEPTDFGPEYEVSCDNKTRNGRTLQLLAEQQGKKTVEGAARTELRANRWLVRQAQGDVEDSAAHDAAAPVRGHGRQAWLEDILQQVRQALAKHPDGSGIHGLRHALHSAPPEGGSENTDGKGIRRRLKDYGIALDDERIQKLLGAYGDNGNGGGDAFSADAFLIDLREPLSGVRKIAIQEAFRTLDPNASGQVTLQQLEGSHNAEAAVGAIRRSMNILGDDFSCPSSTARCSPSATEDTTDTLRWGWRAAASEGGGKISLDDFECYYQDLCLDRVEDDDTFGAILRASWGLD